MTPQPYLFVTRQLEWLVLSGTVEEIPQQYRPHHPKKWFSLVDVAVYQQLHAAVQKLLTDHNQEMFCFPPSDHPGWVELNYYDLLYIRWLEIDDWVTKHSGIVESVRLNCHPKSKIEVVDSSNVNDSLDPSPVPKQVPQKQRKSAAVRYGKLALFE